MGGSMEMSRGQKRALKVGTLAPFFYVALLLASSLVTSAVASTPREPGMTPATFVFFALIALAPVVAIGMSGLTVVYVLLAVRATEGDAGRRVLWILAVVLLGTFGQVAFYSKVVSPRAETAETDTQAPSPDSFEGWG